MAVETYLKLRCDAYGCDTVKEAATNEQRQPFFRRAADQGWHVGDDVLCPLHAASERHTKET